MSFLKEVRNHILRCVSDAQYDREKQHARRIAYAETGDDFVTANKTGRYINGKKAYKRHYQEAIAKADARKKRRDSFISDL